MDSNANGENGVYKKPRYHRLSRKILGKIEGIRFSFSENLHICEIKMNKVLFESSLLI